MPRAGQHSWTEDGDRHERHTDRACYACGLIKRTRHEGRRHWQEFYRREADGSLRLVAKAGEATPRCPGMPDQQALAFASEAAA